MIIIFMLRLIVHSDLFFYENCIENNSLWIFSCRFSLRAQFWSSHILYVRSLRFAQ